MSNGDLNVYLDELSMPEVCRYVANLHTGITPWTTQWDISGADHVARKASPLGRWMSLPPRHGRQGIEKEQREIIEVSDITVDLPYTRCDGAFHRLYEDQILPDEEEDGENGNSSKDNLD